MKKVLLLLVLTCFKVNAFVSDAHETDLSYEQDFSYGSNSLSSYTNTNLALSFIPENNVIDDVPQSELPRANWFTVDDGLTFGIMQLAAAGVSFWASESPEAAGWFLTGSSVFMLNLQNRASGAVSFTALAALGTYNIYVDEEETSKSDIFVTNMIGLNLLMLSMAATDMMFPGLSDNVLVYPDMNGNWYINYNYNF